VPRRRILHATPPLVHQRQPGGGRSRGCTCGGDARRHLSCQISKFRRSWPSFAWRITPLAALSPRNQEGSGPRAAQRTPDFRADADAFSGREGGRHTPSAVSRKSSVRLGNFSTVCGPQPLVERAGLWALAPANISRFGVSHGSLVKAGLSPQRHMSPIPILSGHAALVPSDALTNSTASRRFYDKDRLSVGDIGPTFSASYSYEQFPPCRWPALPNQSIVSSTVVSFVYGH
jgi:hypothetical protein